MAVIPPHMMCDDLACFCRRGLFNVWKLYHILNVLSIPNDKNKNFNHLLWRWMLVLAYSFSQWLKIGLWHPATWRWCLM